MLILIAASLLKAIDVHEFESALTSQWGVPSYMGRLLAVIIPGLECFISLAWFFGVGRRLSVLAAVTFLVGVTGAFVWLWVVRAPPDCACFGRIKAFEQSQNAAAWAVIRNVGFILLLVAGSCLSWKDLLPHACRSESGADP